MAQNKSIKDREHSKFIDSPTRAEESAVEVVIGNPDDISSGGSSIPHVAGVITEMSINASTWTKIPVNSLENRRSVAVQNFTGDEIKLNYSDSISGYVGVVVKDKNERFYDMSPPIELYAKSISGTVTIIVEELA